MDWGGRGRVKVPRSIVNTWFLRVRVQAGLLEGTSRGRDVLGGPLGKRWGRSPWSGLSLHSSGGGTVCRRPAPSLPAYVPVRSRND